ncbi:MAG: phosphate-starvation-inducible PsiE family protein [Cyanobium sp.]
MSWLKRLRSDSAYLGVVDRAERQLAKVLAGCLLLVMVVAAIQLVFVLALDLLQHRTTWIGEPLIRLLGDLLTLLIGLEVLQNITSYLRRRVVQIDLVLLTAMTAVGRKVIVLPPGSENKPLLLLGLGIAVLCLATAYWLVRHSARLSPETRTEPARSSQGGDPSARPDDGDGH